MSVVVVYRGSAVRASVRLNGYLSGDRFGESIDTAGHPVNLAHDGMVVGSPGYGGGRGRDETYFSNNHRIDGETPGDSLGFVVAGSGDMDKEGTPEVAVGSPGYAPLPDPDARVWMAGDSHDLRWRGVDPADIWLIGDDGLARARLAARAGGRDTNEVVVTVPSWGTQSAYLQWTPSDTLVRGMTVTDTLDLVPRITVAGFRAAHSVRGTTLLWRTDADVPVSVRFRVQRRSGDT